MNSGKHKHAKRRARSWLTAGVIINGVRYVVADSRAYQKYMRELRHPGGPVYQKYMQGLQSIHQNTKPKPEPNHIVGVNKRAEPEPKPLLADAKEGWLVTNREGHTSTIKYVDNNKEVLKYAYEVSDGTTIYVRENGMFNIINHNSNYDIIATEPLAEEGTAEWAWQMAKLGIETRCYEGKIRVSKSGLIEVCYNGMAYAMPLTQSPDNKAYTIKKISQCSPTGWQLYEEPEPVPVYDIHINPRFWKHKSHHFSGVSVQDAEVVREFLAFLPKEPVYVEPPKKPEYTISKRCGGSQSVPSPEVSTTAYTVCPKCGGTGYEIAKEPQYKVGDCKIELVKQVLKNLLDKI